ncbi:MAG: hypothetical protein FJX76_24825, partial [Armatimonadetes bacterium]|nr:hypothetical protein [Armatimonadota bacterium]
MSGGNRTAAISTLLLIAALALWGLSASAAGGAKWALVVGVDRYERSQRVTPLQFAGADAREVARTLREAAGFPPENVLLLTTEGGELPTSDNVLAKLEGLKSVVQPGDTFVFYFSGHGVECKDERYLLTSDANPGTQALLRKSALSVREVQDALREVRASRILQLVDACANDPFKGRAGGDDSRLSDGLRRDLVLDAHRAGGDLEAAVTVLSCKVGQRSYEGYKGHGYFTWFLLEGLRGAAADADGAVTVPRLVSYLKNTVPKAVKLHEFGKDQEPDCEAKGTAAMEWVLARVVRMPPPSSAPTAVAVAHTPRPAVPPQVRINAPGTASAVARDSVMLVGTISAEGGLSEVSVSVNGRDVPLAGAALKRSAGGAQVNVRVPLEVGDNSVVLMATSTAGKPAQAVVTVERTAPPVAPQPTPRPVAQATPAPVVYNPPPPPPQSNEMVNDADGSVLLRIPGGAFTMG